MTLPKLETPTYSTTLPSTKKKVSYRPYTVKEEKILLLAQESNDSNEMLNAMVKIVDVCTMEKLKVNDLAVVDLEWLFLKMKAKSSGEIVKLQIKCENCEATTPLEINLDEASIKYPEEELSEKIMVSDSIGVVMRKPRVQMMLDHSETDERKIEAIMYSCVVSIFDDNKVYDMKDVSLDEFKTFVDSLTEKQLTPIVKYIEQNPSIFLEKKWKCAKCGHENTTLIEGFENFF